MRSSCSSWVAIISPRSCSSSQILAIRSVSVIILRCRRDAGEDDPLWTHLPWGAAHLQGPMAEGNPSSSKSRKSLPKAGAQQPPNQVASSINPCRCSTFPPSAEPMSPNCFENPQMLRRRTVDVGVHPLTPHQFRRAFALCSLRSRADVFSLQRVMGPQHAQCPPTLREAVGSGLSRSAQKERPGGQPTLGDAA